MEKYYPRYSANKESWNQHIEKIAKSAGKYPLHEIEGISITKEEMSIIQNINNKVLERLAFTALCVAKFGNIKNDNNNSWVNIEEKELFDIANISGSAKDRSKKLGQLSVLGLVEFPKRNDNMHFRITFAKDDQEELFVSDFRNLGYQYQKYRGESGFIKCAQCGKIITKGRNGGRRYCDDCAGYTLQKFKTITCIDCGCEFEVSSLNNQTNRCKSCYETYRQMYYRQNKQKQREIS